MEIKNLLLHSKSISPNSDIVQKNKQKHPTSVLSTLVIQQTKLFFSSVGILFDTKISYKFDYLLPYTNSLFIEEMQAVEYGT